MNGNYIKTARFLAVLLVVFFQGILLASAQVEYRIDVDGASTAVTPLEPGTSVTDFYSYNDPFPASSNTGFEMDNAAVYMLVKDDLGDVNLVTLIDGYNDGSGGILDLTMTSDIFPSPDLSFVVQDDPGENFTIGDGFAHTRLNWGGCCTDGLALGALPATNWDMALDLDVERGLDNVYFLSQTGFEATMVDLVFVVSEGGSINSTQFAQMKQFMLDTVNSLNVSASDFNVAIIGTLSAPRTILNLSANKTTILNAIQSFRQRGGASCIYCGLNLAAGLFPSSRPQAKRMVVYVGNGLEYDVNRLRTAVQALRRENATTLSVDSYISTPYDANHLIVANGDSDRVFPIASFAAFSQSVDAMAPIRPSVELISMGAPADIGSFVISRIDNRPPVADAGADQPAVVGDTVVLDGNASTDSDGDALTYSWILDSIPAGSTAGLADADQAIASFVPDVAGVYTASLVVNDGLMDSSPDSMTVTVISPEEAIADTLADAVDTILALDRGVLKNGKMKNALSNKINAVLDQIDAGDYAAALDKLRNDILPKTDGCAGPGGAPDRNDWIKTCEDQGSVYPLVIDTIDYVERLL